MKIFFRMKRPLKHFINKDRGRLRSNAPLQISHSQPDVDNLAKFALDSLNGLIYNDDQQVVALQAVRLFDDKDLCLGSTEGSVRVLCDDDLLGLS